MQLAEEQEMEAQDQAKQLKPQNFYVIQNSLQHQDEQTRPFIPNPHVYIHNPGTPALEIVVSSNCLQGRCYVRV